MLLMCCNLHILWTLQDRPYGFYALDIGRGFGTGMDVFDGTAPRPPSPCRKGETPRQQLWIDHNIELRKERSLHEAVPQ